MDTSTNDVEPDNVQETSNNINEESTSSANTDKRKRSTKNKVEIDPTSISIGRPRRTLPKRNISLFYT